MAYQYDWQKIGTAVVVVLVVYLLYKKYIRESFGLRHSNILTAYDPVPLAQMQGAPRDYPDTTVEGLIAPHNVPYSTYTGTAPVAPVVKSCPVAINDVGALADGAELLPANEIDNYVRLHPYE